ncbi:MAG: hypothetical protein A3C22_01805 [Candidatus Levybacteria bacterium RIFCSPHIGHO2_02_FULL_37_10]|nr:MAG: hypothetical protein A3C22_01805 [Candidatus Levybacteria bacterium RIFCSPHIGHO2_02_FULL_37_10]
MDDTTILGAALGQLGQTVKQVAKQVVKMPEEMAGDLSGQVGGSVKQNETQAVSAKGSGEPQWKSNEEREKFLRDLYGSTQPLEAKADQAKQPVNQTSANPLESAVENKKPSEFQEQIADKSPGEQKKLMELRNQLHREVYYDPTFNPVKRQEERPAEKVEQEKKQEMAELQKKEEKKPPPLAVVREQNKAEMFRGASG